jgi:hypothetical protein
MVPQSKARAASPGEADMIVSGLERTVSWGRCVGAKIRPLAWREIDEAREAHPLAPIFGAEWCLQCLQSPMWSSGLDLVGLSGRVAELRQVAADNLAIYDEATVIARGLLEAPDHRARGEYVTSLEASARAELAAMIVSFSRGTWPTSRATAIRAAGEHRTVSIPGEPGETVTVCRLPPAVIRRAAEDVTARAEASTRRWINAAKPDLLRTLADLSEAMKRTDGTIVSRMLDLQRASPETYSFQILLRAGVVAWTYDAPLPQSVDLLDESTAFALVAAILAFSQPELLAPVPRAS